ncbi:MAG: RHS repeat protein, partial [Clostridia bacterium]|nr:RHS repeat protein [Clostridia bacterium]
MDENVVNLGEAETAESEIMTLSDVTDSVSLYADNQSFMPVCAGGRVNLNTGEFYYFNEDINVGGEAFPFALTHRFVSHKNKYASWGISTMQNLYYLDISPNTPYYSDGLGNSHVFGYDSENETGVTSDGSGLNLKLKGYRGYLYDFCIFDRHGNKMIFDNQKYRLNKIIDANGNYINIEGYPTTKLTDSFGRVTNIEYDENGNMRKIIDSSNRTTAFEYDENNYLIKITYPDNTTVEFSDYSTIYLDYQRIGRIKERDGVSYVLTYSDRKLTKVEKYASDSDTTTDDPVEYIEFEYSDDNYVTIVKDRSEIRKIYIFDGSGRVINTYDDKNLVIEGVEVEDRYQIINAVAYQYKDKKRNSSIIVNQNDNEINMIKNGSFEMGAAYWEYASEEGSIKSNIAGVISTDSIDEEKSYFFNYLLSANYNTREILSQTIETKNLKLDCGSTFILSAWLKNLASGIYQMCADVQYEGDYSETFSVEFGSVEEFWHNAAVPIVIDKEKVIKSIRVYFVCPNVSNVNEKCLIDNVRLVNASANSVEYAKKLSETVTVFGDDLTIKEKVTSFDGIYTTTQEKDANYDVVRTIIT